MVLHKEELRYLTISCHPSSGTTIYIWTINKQFEKWGANDWKGVIISSVWWWSGVARFISYREPHSGRSGHGQPSPCFFPQLHASTSEVEISGCSKLQVKLKLHNKKSKKNRLFLTLPVMLIKLFMLEEKYSFKNKNTQITSMRLFGLLSRTILFFSSSLKDNYILKLQLLLYPNSWKVSAWWKH